MTTSIHFAGWLDSICRDVIQAQHSIYLSALSLQPPPNTSTSPLFRFWAELETKAAAGLDVRLYIAAPAKQTPAAAYNGHAAEAAHERGIHAHLCPLPCLLHAKTVSIDRSIAWVGSGNFTAAAAAHNREAWIKTDHPPIAIDLANWQLNLFR